MKPTLKLQREFASELKDSKDSFADVGLHLLGKNIKKGLSLGWGIMVKNNEKKKYHMINSIKIAWYISLKIAHIISMTINIEYFDFDNILKDEKLHENVSNISNNVYNISHKTLMCAKAMHTRFDKVHGFVSVYDRTRYLTLFELENIVPFSTGLDLL